MDEPTPTETPAPNPAPPSRISSIDALRGFVMFAMILQNDLAGAGKQVPDWMSHFSDRHPEGASGLTYVDLIFPAFLFVTGMSIPFAFASRWARGEPKWKTLLHVLARTIFLLVIGILMVNDESPANPSEGWSPLHWQASLYPAAILAFVSWRPTGSGPFSRKIARWLTFSLRALGCLALVMLTLNFQGANGVRIITESPFGIHTDWYGILGLIGWAYLVAASVYLVFRNDRTALLGSMALLYGLFIADRSGAFEGTMLAGIVSIGEALGSQAAITVTGLLLASILVSTDIPSTRGRVRFSLLLMLGCAGGAMLLHNAYGISKNSATPSWCLWSCVCTTGLWLIFHWLADIGPFKTLARPWVLAGQNVLLAYLLSEWLPSLLQVCHLDSWYDGLAHGLPFALLRAACCAAAVLLVSIGINRAGFWVKL